MHAYPRLAAKLFRSPLLLDAGVRWSFETALLARMGAAVAQSSALEGKAPDSRTADIYGTFQNVAIIRIDGVIDKRLAALEAECFGGVDLEVIDEALQQAEHDRAVTHVVLDIHSPGGGVTGTPETAARIARLAQTKEVHAFVNCQACSAAYWLASQADVIAAAPSSCIGSIGVYMALLDETRALEMEGYTVNLIKAGKHKAMGASFQKLTDEERAIFQGQVDSIYADFKKAVTASRRIADSTMQGQSFDGKTALKLGLVDVLTSDSLEEYAGRLLH
ncbi:S49 family peptidase [Verrucomicrobium spinosum]|uniref:S49 family peptidase n=1 Tax=Verrucomicrobium spinosum TaxID=2736 RepID=UPI0001744C07|nr:S49 family peptidase [Verrucomicrobium spinosum]